MLLFMALYELVQTAQMVPLELLVNSFSLLICDVRVQNVLVYLGFQGLCRRGLLQSRGVYL